MGRMRVLDHTGDTVLEWNQADVASVARAAAMFEHQLHRRHRVPYARRHDETANRARPIVDFDPSVEEIVWAAPVVGG
jgi:hypothetical protein